ncbi:hypothetical protein HMPREF9120_00245 [Neisseria sp. oral taxon 020 str. F0370]|nr:hypothetical protein HMPREF9120_00245 [Neisseria sp. oral taxon 020 str. F0370]
MLKNKSGKQRSDSCSRSACGLCGAGVRGGIYHKTPTKDNYF